jgi:hypothetical protein
MTYLAWFFSFKTGTVVLHNNYLRWKNKQNVGRWIGPTACKNIITLLELNNLDNDSLLIHEVDFYDPKNCGTLQHFLQT